MGEDEAERGAFVGPAAGPHLAAVPLDDAAHVGQTDARALELRRAMQPMGGTAIDA